jgi:Secretion system C-terminal sorting domain
VYEVVLFRFDTYKQLIFMKLRLYLLVTLMSLIGLEAFSQIMLLEETYQTFDGRKVNVWLIEGEKVVLNIDKNEINGEQLADLSTLSKLLERTDKLYNFYLRNMGFEPPGGNSRYGFKCNVYFGNPSCGSGCGLVGAKGIEVSGFKNIFYHLKYNLNLNRDGIIGYEFGRNFFTFSDKMLFPYKPNSNERNGGFAEAFADIINLYAYDEIMTEPSQRELNETLLNIPWALKGFRGYITDSTATPYNCFAKWEKLGILDPNRNSATWHEYTAYPGLTALVGIFETFDKKLLFPHFFQILRQRPKVKTIEDALSNIAYSASSAMNQNLAPFFKNVLKFKINADVDTLINKFPTKESFLIRDEPLLWFLSPFETINLNLKSTNYLADNATYKVVIDGTVFSESKNGFNVLKYGLLNGENEKEVVCQLWINGSKKDEFSTKIKKRHDIDIFDYRKSLFAAGLSNTAVKTYFKDDNLVLEHLDKNAWYEGLVSLPFNYSRDRKIQIKGQVKLECPPFEDKFGLLGERLRGAGIAKINFVSYARSNGTANLGYDIGFNDNSNYYDLSVSDSTNFFFAVKTKYYGGAIHFTDNGWGLKSYYKNVKLYDITDTDKDGIVDFEDDCPLSKNNLVSAISLDGNVLKSLHEANTYQWYIDSKKIEGAISKTYLPLKSGKYTLVTSDGAECKSKNSNSIDVVITSTVLEIGKNQISPNPFNKFVKVNFDPSFGQDVNLEVLNLLGTIVHSKTSILNHEPINLGFLPSGTYVIQLVSGSKYESIKVVKTDNGF